MAELEARHGKDLEVIRARADEDKTSHAAELKNSNAVLESLKGDVTRLTEKAAKTHAAREQIVESISAGVTVMVKFLLLFGAIGTVFLTVLDTCAICEGKFAGVISPIYAHAALGLLATVLALLAFWGIGYVEIVKTVESKVERGISVILTKAFDG